MAKTFLTLVCSFSVVLLGATIAWAQIYRYNPQTGQSEALGRTTAPAPSPASVTTRSAPPAMAPAAAQATPAAATSAPSATQPDSITEVLNRAVEEERQRQARTIPPLGRLGIFIDPERYNATVERNIVQLSREQGLDKVYLMPQRGVGSYMYLLKWANLQDVEFIPDAGGEAQRKFKVQQLPAFTYILPDGRFTTYALDQPLAPFYEALTQRQRQLSR